MAYIYIITNKINNKSYIGKTEYNDPSIRWKQHCQDYKRPYYKDRPLYRAINKYSLINFTFKILLETDTPEIDEIKLIKKYDTYKNGYNATLGGDGKKLISKSQEKKIIDYYLKDPLNTSIKCMKDEFLFAEKTIKEILLKNNIEYLYKDTRQHSSKKVDQYDLKGNFLNTFKSAAEAGRSLNNKATNSHIVACCNGKRKTAYGYKWSWL